MCIPRTWGAAWAVFCFIQRTSKILVYFYDDKYVLGIDFNGILILYLNEIQSVQFLALGKGTYH